MIGSVRARSGTLVAAGLVAALASAPGCAFAVDHPAVTVGIVGGTLGFGTCKLASDSYGKCALVGGGAGAFLALVAAAALWLGGDGHTVMLEEQAQPLPDDDRPRKRSQRSPDEPAAPNPADPAAPAAALRARPLRARPLRARPLRARPRELERSRRR